MKKLFLLLTFFGLLATACESGGGVEEENGGNTPTYKIELSKKTIEVDFEEGDYSVSVTSTCSWKASSDNDWIVIESKTGIAGTEELIFRVLTQTEEKERKGTIVIKNTDFNLIVELYIVQKPFEPKITIDSKSLNFAAQGGEQTVNITANFDYTVSTEANWISYSRVDNGLKIRATANTDTEKRTADIVISKENSDISEVININQDAEEAKSQIELSKQIIDVDFEEGSYSISVTSPYSWDAVSKNDWIIVETTTGIAGTEELQFRVLGQTEEKERKGTIVVKNTDYNLVAELYVIQKAFVPSIIVEPETISFTTKGGTQNITTTANFEYEVNTSAEWLSCTKNNNSITIAAPIYVGSGERTAVVTVSSEKYNISKIIKVTQTGLSEEEYAKYCIVYTSSDGKVVTPYNTNNIFGANIVSNTYEHGKGIIKFDAPVTSIGYAAFKYCSSLTSVTLGNGVTSIGDYAFYECSSLTSVTIPNSVTSIGEEAFTGCTGELIIDSQTLVGKDYTYSNYPVGSYYGWLHDAKFTKLTIGENVIKIGDYAFYQCSSLTSVTIPNSVTSIGSSAFCNCTSLTSVTIGNSVTSIGERAFLNCTSLTSVTIPNSVTSIGDSAFNNCESLTSITIGNNVTSIGYSTFAYCSSLTSVTIPDRVTSIGDYAFEDCSSLTSVYCKPTTPPAGGYGMFDDNASGRKIYVPTGSVDEYKWGGYWRHYASDIIGYDF